MSRLQIRLFGCPRLVQPGVQEPASIGRSANVLLAYLLLHGNNLHNREKLASTLWDRVSPDSASHSFRTTLWRLRKVLEPSGVERGTYLVVTHGGEVGFNWDSDAWVDVVEFEKVIRGSDESFSDPAGESELKVLENALRLYEGGLLEGFCDDWIVYERERLRYVYIHGLIRLMKSLAQKADYEGALFCGRKILDEDPLRESVHRDIMRLYALNGQRAEAIKQYERLAQLLEQELEVAPMEETTAAYIEIIRMEPKTGRLNTSSQCSKAAIIAHKIENSLEQMGRDLADLRAVLERFRSR